ncbi:MAG: Rieske 2Fe-2S domain-containing protein [Actinobacteria bacterium]|nr:Rieske 2Fe-2S domain-containing protein [Actinomycetota bacterium]
MANAVVALGGTVGLGLTIPLLTSLAPSAEAASTRWTRLTPDEAAAFQRSTDKPLKIYLKVHDVNGYFGASDQTQFVWGVRATDDQLKRARPELFAGVGAVPYPAITMGFVVFSPICPHMGCKYEWKNEKNRFECPCHGSTYDRLGKHDSGPALRGLDPLPLRRYAGAVEVTWIEYRGNTPALEVQKIG